MLRLSFLLLSFCRRWVSHCCVSAAWCCHHPLSVTCRTRLHATNSVLHSFSSLQITVMPTNSSITARTARYNARSAMKAGRSLSLITSDKRIHTRTRSRTKLERNSTKARLEPTLSTRSQTTLKGNSTTRSPSQRTLQGNSAQATLQGNGALPEEQPQPAIAAEAQADI